MKINVGFEMIFECPNPTPMIFNLNVHFTRGGRPLDRSCSRAAGAVAADVPEGTWTSCPMAVAGRKKRRGRSGRE